MTPLTAAIARPVQWVVSPGGSVSVSATTRSTTAGGKGGSPGFLVLSRTRPATPSPMNRSCQRQTQGLDTSARRMISAVPQPAAVARMIRARQTCFCGLLRSATIRSSRSRSVALTSMLIPSRMPQHATLPLRRESYDCVRPLGPPRHFSGCVCPRALVALVATSYLGARGAIGIGVAAMNGEVRTSEFNAFLKEFQDETERGAALVGDRHGSREKKLKETLLAFFAEPDVGAEFLDPVGGGPLSGMVARAKIASCLGLSYRDELAGGGKASQSALVPAGRIEDVPHPAIVSVGSSGSRDQVALKAALFNRFLPCRSRIHICCANIGPGIAGGLDSEQI